jgi:protein-S-isoprenylcysteine O-methyltransferase Ste14
MGTMRICSYLWTVFVIVWLVAAFRTKRAQERMDFGSRLVYSIPVLVGCYLLFSDSFSGWLQERVIPKNVWLESLAILLTTAGIGFAIWARFYLGENWSSAVTIKVDHQLIRTGPYAWVRHPIYSGILVGMIGTALARREPRGIFAVVYCGWDSGLKAEWKRVSCAKHSASNMRNTVVRLVRRFRGCVFNCRILCVSFLEKRVSLAP